MSANLSLQQVRVIDPILTTHAQGFRSQEFIWDKILPPVRVTQSGGQILQFGKESFRLYSSARSPGSSTKRVQFGYSGLPYALINKSLEGSLPREHLRDAMVSPGIDLEAKSVDLPMRILNLELEVEVAQLLTATGTYPAGHFPTIAAGDKWDSYAASDPILQVKAGVNLIRSKIGLRPNTLWLSYRAYIALCDHPKILARFPLRAEVTIGIPELVSVFKIPNVIVGDAVYADDADVFQDAWGNSAGLAYVPDASTYEVPAFGYVYTMIASPEVEQPYYDPNFKTWYFPVTYERAPVITGNVGGYLFPAAVA